MAIIVGTPPGAGSLLQGKFNQAPDQVGCQAASRAFDLAFDLAFDFLPHREAERRFCAVGNPAWMPG
ncbi:hypothetical protein IMF27_17950 [Pseudomonas sp. PCH199]|uniref:hypothetical protein n=1 Tax=unclassified Pseudomonas TaxID=196821 RepID=UPI0015AC6447|nr:MULTISPECIES: hypothetical protein [unclassified Pseudomonas]MCW8277295.1 hypothetical protein [Pseudomonas sp. PCH199]